MSDKKTISERLGATSLFQDLESSQLEAIYAIAELREFKANALVFSESAPANFLFVVNSGKFILDLPNRDHKSFLPGDVFGEIGVLNEDVRSGTVYAMHDSSAIAICGKKLFDPVYLDPKISLRITRALVKQLTNYLRNREQISTRELIEGGETEFTEFKSSLRTNVYTGKREKGLALPILKTIAAFLNTDGGVLIVGVDDSGSIIGIEQDGFPTEDRLLLHVTSLIKSRIGSLFLDFIKVDAIEIDGRSLVRIDCHAASTPAYLTENGTEYFFIRTGPSTTALRTSKIFEYISRRF